MRVKSLSSEEKKKFQDSVNPQLKRLHRAVERSQINGEVSLADRITMDISTFPIQREFREELSALEVSNQSNQTERLGKIFQRVFTKIKKMGSAREEILIGDMIVWYEAGNGGYIFDSQNDSLNISAVLREREYSRDQQCFLQYLDEQLA